MEYSVQSKDCCLQVYERGREDCKELIIFLHGGPGSGASAIMELPAFQSLEQTYHCIYFDQRGCGGSTYDLQQGITIEQIVGDVMQVIKDCKSRYQPDKIFLWGGSFGAALAALTLECYPHAVDKLILSSPALFFSREDALTSFRNAQKVMHSRFSISSELSLGLDRTPEEILQDEAFRKIIFSPMNPSNSLKHMQAMASWFYRYDYTSCIKGIQIPTLVLLGEKDTAINAMKIQKNIEGLQNEKLVLLTFPDCGHAIFQEEELAFVQLIEAFLQRK